MSGVFRNIDPPPPHRPASACVPPPPAFAAGEEEDTLAGWRGGKGSIVRKTPDTALYSIYLSTLWKQPRQDCFKAALPQAFREC
jgi:hypothetical protein